MTEHKADMNITKIDKYKKKNEQLFYDGAQNSWTFLKLKNTKKSKRHFYEGAQNRHEHYWKTEQHFYRGIQNWRENYRKTEQHFYDGTQNRHEKYKKLNGTSMTEHKTDIKRFRNAQFYENVCKLSRQGWVILWLQ